MSQAIGVRTAAPRRALPAVVVLTVAALLPAAAQTIEVTMVEQRGTQFFEPAARRFMVTSEPLRLSVRLRNVSQTSARVNPNPAFWFELTDEQGRITTMKPSRASARRGRPMVYAWIAPGLDINFELEFDPADWSGMPSLVAGEKRRYTVRAIYESYDTRRVTSDPYELVIAIRKPQGL